MFLKCLKTETASRRRKSGRVAGSSLGELFKPEVGKLHIFPALFVKKIDTGRTPDVKWAIIKKKIASSDGKPDYRLRLEENSPRWNLYHLIDHCVKNQNGYHRFTIIAGSCCAIYHQFDFFVVRMLSLFLRLRIF